MDYRSVGASDFVVSALSLGTATFGGGSDFYRAWGSTDVADATRLVDVALDAGVTLFDTADSYSGGMAEEILGKAIAGRRERLLISTKASFRTGPGVDDVGSSRKHLIPACDASLRRLGTDHIDLWSMHGFDSFTPVEETLRAIEEVVRAGKVRYVGCSNFSGWHLMKSLALSDRKGWPRYISHQAYYSLVARDYEWELMPLALDQKIGTVVWSPLSGGQLSGSSTATIPRLRARASRRLARVRDWRANSSTMSLTSSVQSRPKRIAPCRKSRSIGCCNVPRSRRSSSARGTKRSFATALAPRRFH